MLKIADRALVYAMFAIGVLHSVIVAPLAYDEMSPNAIWFFAAGLAVMFGGVLNLLRHRHAAQLPILNWTGNGASAVLLALALVFAVTQAAFAGVFVLMQIITYGLLLVVGLLRTVLR